MKEGIAKYRKLRGYTQEYVAEKLGITVASYCLYENGKRNIPNNIVKALIEVLGIPADEIDSVFLPKTFAICKSYGESGVKV